MNDPRSGWELTKENIQPLSGGRRMADLAEALPARTATGLTDQLQYEEHHLNEIRKLEEIAKQRNGDDPIQPWINVVNYYEQHFPNMSQNVKTRYSQVMSEIVREFYGNERYKNDRRYIRILITNMKTLPPPMQIRLLVNSLSCGFGALVSEMYLRLADLYNSEGETKKAIEVLKQGMQKNAQPKEKLQEMLTYIEDSWASDYAKRLQSGAKDKEAEGRQFAASVPTVGENNEALCIRQNLQLAAPTVASQSASRQNPLPKKLSLYNEENSVPQQDTDSVTRPSDLSRFESLSNGQADRENKLEASRWNVKHTQLENPAIPEPREKLKLYVEETLSVASSSLGVASKNPSMNHRVLKEKKESESSELESVFEPAIKSSDMGNKKIEASSLPTSERSAGTQQIAQEDCSNRMADLAEALPARTATRRTIFDCKYKPLPPGKTYIMLKCEKYLEKLEKEKKAKEEENKEVVKLGKKVNQLTNTIENLRQEVDHYKSLANSVPHIERMLEKERRHNEEKDAKISELEAQNEDLMNQVTRLATENNIRDSRFHKMENEKELIIKKLERKIEEQAQQHDEEIQRYKQMVETLTQMQVPLIKEEIDDDCIEFQKQSSRKKQSIVDVDVCSRTADLSPPSSPSTEQGTGTDEISRFQSGEATVEQQQQESVAASSFMPDLGDEKSMMMSIEYAAPVAAQRKALGMVDRPLASDMMNITPAGVPPMDLEIPPPCFGSQFLKKPTKKFLLYESISDSVSSKPKPTRMEPVGNNRTDIVKKLKSLPENMPPSELAPQITQTVSSDENQANNVLFQEPPARPEENFRMPALPSDESCAPTLPKPRRSILLARMQRDDSSDEEDEVIVRRHQQTGVDLNMSNLTTALALRPKPLINSTPEREKTLRDLSSIIPRNFAQDIETDVAAAPEPPVNRASRYSILNDPPLNLSPIQETSRENRSRSHSTTGSSSGNTMSSTRFGAASSSTHLFGNITSRSASVPRSASRISHQNNMNGYHSDTNGMQ